MHKHSRLNQEELELLSQKLKVLAGIPGYNLVPKAGSPRHISVLWASEMFKKR